MDSRRQLVAAGLMIATAYAAAASAEELLTTVSDAALKWNRPPMAPRHSDVCFSIRWLRKEIDPFEKIRSFHGTRFDWLYARGQGDPRGEFLKECSRQGYPVSHATSVANPDVAQREGQPRTYRVGRGEDIHGEPLVAGWQNWKPPWGCVCNPGLAETMFHDVRFAIENGVDYILIDDPNTDAMLRWGGDPKDPETRGCFCAHCLARFRRHLQASATTEELKALGVSHLQQFDYKQWILAGNRNAALRRHYEASYRQAIVEFWKSLIARAERQAGRHFPFACNNGSFTRWDPPIDLFDFAVGELSEHDPPTPASLWKKATRIARMNKAQAVTLRSVDPPENRRVLSLSYALGLNFVCPWDVWITGSERYYGEPGDYNDLYAFVRGNACWLDGYEYSAAVGKDISDDWYGDTPPVVIEGNDEAYAFVRAVPGDHAAPVAIHLVDVGKEPRPFALTLNHRRLFVGGLGQCRLLIPSQQTLPAHQEAEATKDFSRFILATKMRGDRQDDRTRLEIPKLTPWAILLVSPVR